VNSVNPGGTATEIYKSIGISKEQYAKSLEERKGIHPLGRVGDAEEMAQAIAFLASSSASFITGEHLHVDGGWHAACLR